MAEPLWSRFLDHVAEVVARAINIRNMGLRLIEFALSVVALMIGFLCFLLVQLIDWLRARRG
jgi:uncharacterized membrane protein